jgi:hypothetical protein
VIGVSVWTAGNIIYIGNYYFHSTQHIPAANGNQTGGAAYGAAATHFVKSQSPIFFPKKNGAAAAHSQKSVP